MATPQERTAQATYHCQCGAVLGEACEWHGPAADMVVVEWMPEYLRASHEAARNRGIWPYNGSERLALERECAERLLESDPEWAALVDGAEAADYADADEE